MSDIEEIKDWFIKDVDSYGRPKKLLTKVYRTHFLALSILFKISLKSSEISYGFFTSLTNLFTKSNVLGC